MASGGAAINPDHRSVTLKASFFFVGRNSVRVTGKPEVTGSYRFVRRIGTDKRASRQCLIS